MKAALLCRGPSLAGTAQACFPGGKGRKPSEEEEGERMFPKLGSHHRLPKAQGRAAEAQTQEEEEEDPDPGGSGRGMFWQVPVTSLPRNIVRLS